MSYLVTELADYAANLSYEQIPPETLESARKCVLDSVGNVICGRYTETGGRILEYAKAYPVEEASLKATVVGVGKCSLEQTLLLHAVMARCADLDDGSRRAMGHPGCVLVPTALAVAEAYGRSGADVLCALTAGYDIYIRTGSAINPTSYRDRGFDATGLCGAVAAAAVSAKLMGEDRRRIADAMGIAALFAGGLIEYQNDGTMGKTLCGAWAASTGLRAARLANVGFTGPVAAFEGKKAFMQAFSNEPNGEFVLKKLGSRFCIDEVYFKLHACMRGLHSAIDAALQLRGQLNLTPETIRQITVWTTPFVQRLSNSEPDTVVGAQCSLQFTMATAIRHGHLAEEKLLSESLRDPVVRELSSKIRCHLDERMQAYVKEHPTHWSAVRVEAEKLDGTRAEAVVYLPAGEPENPLSWEKLEDKFRRLVQGTPAAAEEILPRIRRFEAAAPAEVWG